MNTIRLRHILALTAAILMAYGAQAQKLKESVTVEGHYTPDIISADRMALPPVRIPLKAPESPMEYDRQGVAADFAPDALSMTATGWRATKNYDSSRGYADFRLGSWLNSSLSAGYTVLRNEYTRLNAYIQHNSTSLWQAWQAHPASGKSAADRRYRYDETIGADLTHRIADTGTLSAALEYHLGYFNYYGTNSGPTEDGHIKAPDQTLNDFHAKINWTGQPIKRLSYRVGADVRHFAYRAMYLPSLISSVYPAEVVRSKGERETTIDLKGNITYRLKGNSKIELEGCFSGVTNAIGNDVQRVYAVPAYTSSGRTSTLRIGANVAAVHTPGSTRLRIAPDIRFTARKNITAFSASVGGGTHLRTLAWKHMMDYYDDPSAGCYGAAYTPLDIRLALQFNPGGKWTWGLEGEWRTTLDESFGGLYQALLNYNFTAIDGFCNTGRIHGFSIAVNAGYEFSRYFVINGKASWQPQKGTSGFLNGFDRPQLTADLDIKSRPTDRLSISLEWHARARRQFGLSRLTRLNLGGEYRITDKISAGMELNNLLNRHQELLPGLPLEGFNANAGVQIVF